MKILHLETGRRLYGGALQVLHLLRGLSDAGTLNTLVCPEDSEIASVAQHDGHCLVPLPFSGDLDARLCPSMWRIIRQHNPDIVHVHSRRGADLWGGLAARFAGVKAVLTRRVDNVEPAWLLRTKCHSYHAVIAISQAVRQVLLSSGVPASRLRLVRSAVEAARYRCDCDRAWLRKTFRLSSDARVIGMVAQFIPRKGHRYAIAALARIRATLPQTHLLLLGRGPLESELRRQCHQAGVADAVRFGGFRADIERVLPCLDLLVHPALAEGLGVAVLQAQAAGVPVVAARAGGLPEVVEEGVTGHLVPAHDVEALAAVVVDLLRDPARASRIGQAGQQRAISEFGVEQMVDGYRRVYRDIL